MKIKLTTITWKGNNYIQIIQALGKFNQELKVQIKGKRLVVKDEDAGYYRIFALDDLIEAPERFCEPDEPITYTEPVNIPIQTPTPEPARVWSVGGVWGEDSKTLGDLEPHLFS